MESGSCKPGRETTHDGFEQDGAVEGTGVDLGLGGRK